MFKMSDILKRNKNAQQAQPAPKLIDQIRISAPMPSGQADPGQQPTAPGPAAPTPAPAPNQSAPAQPNHQNQQSNHQPEPFHVSVEKTISEGAQAMIASAVRKETDKDAEPQARALYEDVCRAIERCYTADLAKEPHFVAEINARTEKALAMITTHERSLQALYLIDYPDLEKYLYHDVANVFFLSLEMGLELGFDRARLLDLGAGAFLCDIGLEKVAEHKKREGLDKREYEKIRQHPAMGAQILKTATAKIGETILAIVAQTHERIDGSGYPAGLVAEEISTFAQIVGLADMYEALTHKRPYRQRFTPTEAFDMILKNRSIFGPKIVKALINRIGVYPVGTLIVLNSKETGVVVTNRPELPFRPVVSVVYDPYGKEYVEPKEIDLAKNPIIYIEDCVKEKA